MTGKNEPANNYCELAANIGRTTRSVELQIQKLKESGKIERVGPDKGGHWKVK